MAYLDCDVGQSEFGPGGTVGLYLVAEPQFGSYILARFALDS